MQEQPELVGGGAAARSAIGGEMGFPRLDVVLGLAAGTVDAFVQCLAGPTGQAGDDEAGVAAAGAGLDAGDDTLDPAPGSGAIVDFLEATDHGAVGRLGPCYRGDFQRCHMAAQHGGGRQPRMKSTPRAR